MDINYTYRLMTDCLLSILFLNCAESLFVCFIQVLLDFHFFQSILPSPFKYCTSTFNEQVSQYTTAFKAFWYVTCRPKSNKNLISSVRNSSSFVSFSVEISLKVAVFVDNLLAGQIQLLISFWTYDNQSPKLWWLNIESDVEVSIVKFFR